MAWISTRITAVSRYLSAFIVFLLNCVSVTALDGDDGANVVVGGFFILVSAALLIASLIDRRWSRSELTDFMLRRCLMLLGFLSSYVTCAVLIVMVNETASLQIAGIIATYMEVFGYAILAGIILLVWNTLKQLISLIGERNMNQRMGGGYGEDE